MSDEKDLEIPKEAEREIELEGDELQAALAQEFGGATTNLNFFEGQSAEIENPIDSPLDSDLKEAALISVENELPSELEDIRVKSILESLLFASAQPLSLSQLKSVFTNTNVDGSRLHGILEQLQMDYSGGERGISFEEVAGGFQLRTKSENAGWLRKLVKARPFKLSGPALEVLSIVAYKQPIIKSEIDQIRGVESGHLLRALIEKNIIKFAGKSELPGKPMLYATSKLFLELFGLRNIRELPTLSEIDKLLPEGIGDISEIEGGETLGSLADKIALAPGKSYSESESELLSITTELGEISTTTGFFEQEKIRERERRDQERAQDLRERKIMGETLVESDQRWLSRFEDRIEKMIADEKAAQQASQATDQATESQQVEGPAEPPAEI